MKRSAVMLLAVCAVSVFGLAVRERRAWFGGQSTFHHYWLTAHTLRVLRNWHEEGISNNAFAMIRAPASVEEPTLQKRGIYVSYMSGALFPLHAIGKFYGRPDGRLVMGYNLFNHLLVIFFCGLIGYLVLRRMQLEPVVAAALSLVPVCYAGLLPSPMYFLHFVFFTDQAVIAPFVIAVFLEVFEDSRERPPRWLPWCRAAVYVWGISADWFFAFVLFFIYLVRLLRGKLGKLVSWTFIRRSVGFWLAPALTVLAFAGHVLMLGRWDALVSRGAARMAAPETEGLGMGTGDWTFWCDHFARQFGGAGLVILLVSVALCLAALVWFAVRRRKGPVGDGATTALAAIGMIMLPCFTQMYVFRNHTSVHDFSVLKLTIPMALVPFLLLPALVLELAKARPDRWWYRHCIAPPARGGALIVLLALAAGLYLVGIHPLYLRQFPPLKVTNEEIAQFVGEQTDYHDVVFSPSYEIATVPPQYLLISDKKVYKTETPQKFAERVRSLCGGLEEPFDVNLLFAGRPGRAWAPVLQGADRPISFQAKREQLPPVYLFKNVQVARLLLSR